MVGCSVCVCQAGELNCLPRLSCPQHLLQPLPHNTGLGAGVVSGSLQVGVVGHLPCGCHDHWVPVCANNGRTFPSECLARCAGVGEGVWRAGECGDECVGVRCGRGHVCMAAPVTCLTLPSTACPQHICVPLEGECPDEASGPACDSRGRQFSTLCRLARDGASLAYLGTCKRRCSSVGVVCGRDGRTWTSECHAHAHYVSLDYRGPCRAVGVPGTQCPGVVCPPAPHPSCVGVEWSGWCCGRVCGGGVVVSWSTRAVEVAAVVLPTHRPLTLTALLAALAAHVSVSECQVLGQITLEGNLLVLLTPTAAHTPTPPPLVAGACVVEAERLVGVVRARSPRLMSALPAAALTLAAPAHTSAAHAAAHTWTFTAFALLISKSLLAVQRMC
nr:reversion-inducing cysteine-rich protein with Kazal motifs-like [Cherax quadricarinatus]